MFSLFSSAHSTAGQSWLKAAVLVALTWAALGALLWPSLDSMVAVWNSSETYTHGYIVLPVSLWLIWRQRQTLLPVPAMPDWRALLAVAGLSALWLAASVAGVQLVQHYALVSLAIASVWALLGWRLVWALVFPLAYLLLMVPSGDSLIPALVHFTAEFTVATLRLMGFTVFQEGTFFSITSGNWNVVEACSGIRYFLSSIVLGWLYAYLSYRTWWKRVAFGVAAIIVPIVANGLRAVLIVLIAHFSDMTLAVGVDHLIYGWVWFGIVMGAMFWVGNRWREDQAEEASPPPPVDTVPVRTPAFSWPMALAIVAIVGVHVGYAEHLLRRAPQASPLPGLNAALPWQTAPAALTAWQPQWRGEDDQRTLTLTRDKHTVMLHVGWYGTQRQDAELISSTHALVHPENSVWRNTDEYGRRVDLGGAALDVREALIDSPESGQKLLVWYWNHVDGRDTTRGIYAKLVLAWHKVLGQSDAGSIILLAAAYRDKPEEAAVTLKQAALDMRLPLAKLLDGDTP